MKYTGADAGTDTGSRTVCSVQRVVGSVQCPASHWQGFSTSNKISLTKFLFLISDFQKRISSNRLKIIHEAYTFLKA